MVSSALRRYGVLHIRKYIKSCFSSVLPHYDQRSHSLGDIQRQSEKLGSETMPLTDESSLQKIWMNDMGIGEQGACVLAKTLLWENVKELHIGGNQIGNLGTAAIVENITGCLEKLNLYNNDVGVDGAEALGDAINRTKNLKSLWLHDNQIGNKGLAKIAPFAFSLKELWLGDNLIGDEGMIWLSESINGPGSLQSLWLHNNNIGDEGIRSFAQAFQPKMNLKSLCLSGNRINAAGAEALVEALLGNPGLEELKLRSNNVGDIGAKVLARYLEANTGKLLKLNLNDNNIGTEGAMALAEALIATSKECVLCIRGNPIGNEGAAALAACRSPERVVFF